MIGPNPPSCMKLHIPKSELPDSIKMRFRRRPVLPSSVWKDFLGRCFALYSGHRAHSYTNHASVNLWVENMLAQQTRNPTILSDAVLALLPPMLFPRLPFGNAVTCKERSKVDLSMCHYISKSHTKRPD